LFKPNNVTGGIGEFDFFDNPRLYWVFKLDNIIGGIGELEFFDNRRLVALFETKNNTGGVGNLIFLTTFSLFHYSSLITFSEELGNLKNFLKNKNIFQIWCCLSKLKVNLDKEQLKWTRLLDLSQI
jgi:hypothetical protein